MVYLYMYYTKKLREAQVSCDGENKILLVLLLSSFKIESEPGRI